jgi:hypothetical protein
MSKTCVVLHTDIHLPFHSASLTISSGEDEAGWSKRPPTSVYFSTLKSTSTNQPLQFLKPFQRLSFPQTYLELLLTALYMVTHLRLEAEQIWWSTMCVSIPFPEQNGTLFWSGDLHPTIFYTSRMSAGSGEISNRTYRVWQWSCRGKYDYLTILTLVVNMSRRKYAMSFKSLHHFRVTDQGFRVCRYFKGILFLGRFPAW